MKNLNKKKISKSILYNWAKDLFPINRSLTGPGNLETLSYLKKIIPDLKIKKIKSRTKINSWKVPDEWIIKDGYIKNNKNKKILDFNKSNLHILGFSTKVNKILNYKELSKNLYYLKKQPNVIPYVTSYYKKKWGFCISYNKFKKINKNQKYHVFIDSKFKKGSLIYGELLIKGKSKREILISTNICHPSLGNNELSGPIVSTGLAKYLSSKKNYFSYRILFLPETIGSIAYIDKYKKKLKKNVVAGFVAVCVGDNKSWSVLNSPSKDLLCDNLAKYILDKNKIKYTKFNFDDHRGSDERQYCWPGVDLPICSVMRSKYGTYKEYHTSADNLDFISADGLWGSFTIYKKMFSFLEKNNDFYENNLYGKSEPFLTKYNLINSTSIKADYKKTNLIMKLIYLTTKKKNIIDLSTLTNNKIKYVRKVLKLLIKKKIIRKS